MTNDFATAMRRALGKTRAIDPAAATAIIQKALAGKAGPTLTRPAPTRPTGSDPQAAPPANPFASLMRDGCRPCAGGGGPFRGDRGIVGRADRGPIRGQPVSFVPSPRHLGGFP